MASPAARYVADTFNSLPEEISGGTRVASKEILGAMKNKFRTDLGEACRVAEIDLGHVHAEVLAALRSGPWNVETIQNLTPRPGMR